MSRETDVKFDSKDASNPIMDDGKELVIIDCDAGTDDALALLLALNSKLASRIRVLGVTCVGGNTTLDNVIKNVLGTLKVVGREEIPVYNGATMGIALRDDLKPHHIQGDDGLGGAGEQYPISDAQAEEILRRENAVDWLGRTVDRYPSGAITLITLGPVTNVAFAHRLFPQMESRLKRLVVMGGTLNAKGNSGLTSEFNFDCDPEAAHCVLEEFTCPIMIMSFDTCFAHQFDFDWYDKVLSDSNSVKSKFVRAMFQASIEYQSKQTYNGRRSFYACDWLAMVCALYPRVIMERVYHYVVIELTGQMTRGQTVVHWRDALNGKRKVEMIVKLDRQEVKKIIRWRVGA